MFQVLNFVQVPSFKMSDSTSQKGSTGSREGNPTEIETPETAGNSNMTATNNDDSSRNSANNEGTAQAANSDSTTSTAAAPQEEKTKDSTPPEGNDEESDDDGGAEVIEESPCGRWLKRKEEIKYRDVPGIDTAYLSMDSEEGVEVVWNEAQFSTQKKFKAREDKLNDVFEALTLIEHPNIVNFHKFWTDSGDKDKGTLPRLIFITEYMQAGSLKMFLRKAKKNQRKIQVQAWKRWCTQILSALSYLHQTCDPAIIHGNLTCDTIFIQHNGLVKIGSIAPDIIHQNVKTCRDNIKNLHYLAPEWGEENKPGTPSDIYAFGICALETAAVEIQLYKEQRDQDGASALVDGIEGGGVITAESIERAIDSLEDNLQKDFIRQCLRKNPAERPTARELLFHPVLFEVHSLKLLAAHSLVNTPGNISGIMTDEAIQKHYGFDSILASVEMNGQVKEFKLSNVPVAEKLEKFMEDVKFGIYPITAFAMAQAPIKTRAITPDHPGRGGAKSEGETSKKAAEEQKEGSAGPEKNGKEDDESKKKGNDSNDSKKNGKGTEAERNNKYDPELRRIVQVLCAIETMGERKQPGVYVVYLIVRFEDAMNRMLFRKFKITDRPDDIIKSAVKVGFIAEADMPLITACFADALRKMYCRMAIQLTGAKEEAITGVMTEQLNDYGYFKNTEVMEIFKKIPFWCKSYNEQIDSYLKTVEDHNETLRARARANGEPEPELAEPNPDLKVPITKELKKRNWAKLSDARDAFKAAQLKDAFNITNYFLLPIGTFFTPPCSDDHLERASTPFKIPHKGTNAFDSTALEETLEKMAIEYKKRLDDAAAKLAGEVAADKDLAAKVAAEQAKHTEAALAAAAAAATPKEPAAAAGGAAAAVDATAQQQQQQAAARNDTMANLQGAQKALEGLSLQQQQQQSAEQQVSENGANGGGGGEGQPPAAN